MNKATFKLTIKSFWSDKFGRRRFLVNVHTDEEASALIHQGVGDTLDEALYEVEAYLSRAER